MQRQRLSNHHGYFFRFPKKKHRKNPKIFVSSLILRQAALRSKIPACERSEQCTSGGNLDNIKGKMEGKLKDIQSKLCNLFTMYDIHMMYISCSKKLVLFVIGHLLQTVHNYFTKSFQRVAYRIHPKVLQELLREAGKMSRCRGFCCWKLGHCEVHSLETQLQTTQ